MGKLRRTAGRQASLGLTLIELLAVVAMLAILAAVAAPGLSAFLAGQRAKAFTYDLTSDLLLARSEALKRGQSVSLAPVSDGWSAGWTMTVGDEVLSGRSGVAVGVAVDDAPDEIVFNRNGRLSAPSDPVRITVRSTHGENGRLRCIEVDPSGRAHVVVEACT